MNEFTSDWTAHYIENLKKYLHHLKGKPLHYLETGVFEGRSGVWLLENLLTHPDSTYTGVDCWETCPDAKRIRGRRRGKRRNDVYRMSRAKMRAIRNIKHFGNKGTLYKGLATRVLSSGRFEEGQFDIIYIDDDHSKESVRIATEAAWPLLKVGGIMIWDDYDSKEYPFPGVAPGVAAGLEGKHYQEFFSNIQYAVTKQAPTVYGLKELKRDDPKTTQVRHVEHAGIQGQLDEVSKPPERHTDTVSRDRSVPWRYGRVDAPSRFDSP